MTPSALARVLDVLTLPLLFHQGGPWTEEDRAKWVAITGKDEATTKVMCDTIRETLAALTPADKSVGCDDHDACEGGPCKNPYSAPAVESGERHPSEWDYGYYDQIVRERGLPAAFKHVVDDLMKLRAARPTTPPPTEAEEKTRGGKPWTVVDHRPEGSAGIDEDGRYIARTANITLARYIADLHNAALARARGRV